MVENIIELNLKEFSYHEQILLKDINLTVEKGEFILLTGLSGCGKTTLLRILNGLIPDHYEGHLKGNVKILGKDITEYKKGELAKVMGNVFQNPKDQFFSTIAEDEVALVGENLGMDRDLLIEKVDEAFDTLDIHHLKSSSIFEMSGGEMQKVAIASSLVYDTDLLLLDEPSASLDYQSTLELGKTLKILKEMGKTIIICEHRLFYLKDLFDRMIVIRDHGISGEFSREDVTKGILEENHLRCFDEYSLRGTQGEVNTPVVITVENLDIRIKNRLLIENLAFQLRQGECMGVVGENGVGKTTLLKVLSGLRGAKEKISYGNRKKERLKNSFLLLQDTDSQIFFDTVENELVDKKRLHDENYLEAIKRELKAADLWEKRLDHPQELSTGEKQRLALLISFFKEKEIILLDEPSSGLDFKRMEFAADMIHRMSEFSPVVLITHDMELLFQSANTVLLLSKEGYEKIPVKGNEGEIINFMRTNDVPFL